MVKPTLAVAKPAETGILVRALAGCLKAATAVLSEQPTGNPRELNLTVARWTTIEEPLVVLHPPLTTSPSSESAAPQSTDIGRHFEEGS